MEKHHQATNRTRGGYTCDLTVLAMHALTVPVNQPWAKHDFSFAPSAHTTCASKPTETAPGVTEYLSECSGMFVISVRTPNVTVDVDYTYMAPGDWALLPGRVIPPSRSPRNGPQ
eukprot:6103942-Pyramimonas_sp.AAC.1